MRLYPPVWLLPRKAINADRFDQYTIPANSDVLVCTFTTLLAAKFLKERVSLKKWGAAIIGFVGVLVILKPQPTGFEWAMILPVVAAVSGAFRDVVTRSMGHTESSWSMLWLATIGTIVVGITDIAVSDWLPILWPQSAYFVLSAILLAAAHFFLSEGFRITSASTVSPFKYSHLVWASVLGYFVWGDIPNTMIVAGSVLILLSGVILSRDVATDNSD
jgi:drug/metabolite transporter (DMT)-like permease